MESGGSNVQFAVNPKDGRLVVIEMNPRVSRSSALASKATGFPIAKVAAKLAIGYTLDEISYSVLKDPPPSDPPHQNKPSHQSESSDSKNRIQRKRVEDVKEIPASFEPALDYVVTKIPRFNFEKFADTKPFLF